MMHTVTEPDPIKGDTRPDGLLGQTRQPLPGSVSHAADAGRVPAERCGDMLHLEPEVTMQRSPDQASQHSSDQSCLVQIYPADVVGGMLLIETDQLVIGRDAGCDLALTDASVSRQHAVIRRVKEGFELQDLDSTNGTFIGGRQIKRSLLCSGDTIRFGSFLFKFLSAGSVESQYHETVYSALTRDALTGTMNKRYLLETLGRTIAAAVRQRLPLAIAMVDIDHFKTVNDTYGHLVGDEVLREFGQRVGRACREDDLLARYGGEEFCLVLSATDTQEAGDVAERCRRAVCDQPFNTTAGPLPITASFGFAVLKPGQTASGIDLIQLADNKLYEAKRSGRNCVRGE